ncbi:unnamed protein product [Ixodes pacificus]
MPIDMPKEDTKIVMRPRGGLNVARMEVSIIMSVVMTAARVTKEDAKADTICTNAQQNIIMVSTPDERRATVYSKVKPFNIGGRTYEVSAYRTAPDGTVKGVIRGIAVDDTPKGIAENIVNPYSPLAVEAHRIGNTTTVIVLFAGQKVPNYVKYGSILVRCGLYRKHFDVGKHCGRVGHRRDVCPNPNTRVCFGCGVANASPSASSVRDSIQRARGDAKTSTRCRTWSRNGNGNARWKPCSNNRIRKAFRRCERCLSRDPARNRGSATAAATGTTTREAGAPAAAGRRSRGREPPGPKQPSQTWQRRDNHRRETPRRRSKKRTGW